jgi:(R)-2-hydroxyacyl-CoA dehydratese activating ATPase
VKYFWGVDCGSAEIKVVACDPAGRVLYKHRRRTLFPLLNHVREALIGDGSFASPFQDGHLITATGYGRSHLDFVHDKLTEIKAHHLGVKHQLGPGHNDIYTIVDVGGQDSKVITIKNGEVDQFVINRKCAAGTGAFIEELANRLELKIDDLPEIEKKHDRELTLNSYCTVFAGQEVIKVLMNGEKVENLIHALYRSVVKRVLEMTTINAPMIIFSGGVLTHHAPLRDLFQERLPGKKLLLAPDAQYCGAIGAAIHGARNKAAP